MYPGKPLAGQQRGPLLRPSLGAVKAWQLVEVLATSRPSTVEAMEALGVLIDPQDYALRGLAFKSGRHGDFLALHCEFAFLIR